MKETGVAGRTGSAHLGGSFAKQSFADAQPVTVSQISAMLSALIIIPTAQPIAVVTGWLASVPISVRLLVNRISGSTANGMPKDSTTCESTRVRVGSTPSARIATAGHSV